jgi:hypothetical protein
LARPTPVVSDLAISNPAPSSTETVWITALTAGVSPTPTLRLVYRHRGAYVEVPMVDDGQSGDGAAGDGVFGAAIPPHPGGAMVEYYVAARMGAANGLATTFLPRSASHRPPAYLVRWARRNLGLRLNEFVAKNTTGIVDEKGEREDWVELYNATNQAIALDGRYLTDSLQRPRQWQFPAGTTIFPGSTLLVWCDNEPTEGPLHATFKLDAEGEDLVLIDSDGATLLDHIQFGTQLADVATGRLLDADSPWVTFPVPTPRVPNGANSCGARSYSALDPLAHTLDLDLQGVPRIAAPVTFQMHQAAPGGGYLLLFAADGDSTPVPGEPVVLLTSLDIRWVVLVPAASDGSGSLPVTIPDDPALVGTRLYAQAFSFGGVRLVASNGLEVGFCSR